MNIVGDTPEERAATRGTAYLIIAAVRGLAEADRLTRPRPPWHRCECEAWCRGGRRPAHPSDT